MSRFAELNDDDDLALDVPKVAQEPPPVPDPTRLFVYDWNSSRYYDDPLHGDLDDPKLAEDHPLWVRVLQEAYWYAKEKGGKYMDLFTALHGFRCGGARLEVNRDGVLQMKPGYWEAASYKQYLAKYLTPFKDDVAKVFFLSQQTPVDAREIPVEVRAWEKEVEAAKGPGGASGEQGQLFK